MLKTEDEGKEPVLSKSLDSLTSFVYEPYSRGVEYARISVPTRDLGRLFIRMVGERPSKTDPINRTLERARRGLSLKTFLTGLKSSLLEREQFTDENLALLKPILDWSQFVRDNGAPPEKYANRTTTISSNVIRARIAVRGIPENIAGPSIPLDEVSDALHVTEGYQEDLTLLEATALQEKTVESFVSFTKSIPDVGKDVKIIRKGHQFSSRLSSDLVPVATRAWARSVPTIERVPQFILTYIGGAHTYLDTSEWRTSIVLSAIALESLLAEMFETEFREVAPDQPLGNLYGQIRDKFGSANRKAFPADIEDAIKGCNDSRVAAVHRGGRQLSDKEAYNALHGVARIAIWYYFLGGPA